MALVEAAIAHAARLAESEDIVVAVFHVRRAYFYAEEKRDTFVELPESYAKHCTELAKAAASWGDESRKGLISCNLTVGTVSRCCLHNELRSVAGTVHGDDIFVAGPRLDIAKMGATLKKRWETRDQMIGPKPGDQKELRILNRTLRWCKDGQVFAATLRHVREILLCLLESRIQIHPTIRRCMERTWFCRTIEFASPRNAIHLTRTTWCFYHSN